jgi:hypothetical protein
MQHTNSAAIRSPLRCQPLNQRFNKSQNLFIRLALCMCPPLLTPANMPRNEAPRISNKGYSPYYCLEEVFSDVY